MKNIFLFTILVVFLTACHSNNIQLKTITVDADSVVINYFRGDGSVDTVVTVKIVRDKNAINKLSDYVSAASPANPNVQCGYDGSLHFFKRDSVVKDIFFRMNDAHCMLFSFRQDGKLTATVLSADAKQLLESIREK